MFYRSFDSLKMLIAVVVVDVDGANVLSLLLLLLLLMFGVNVVGVIATALNVDGALKLCE